MKKLIIFLLSFSIAYSQVPNFDIRGNWVGELQVGANIQLIFKVQGEYFLTGSLDVPLQGAKDIPILITETIESIKFNVESINGKFEGKKVDSVTVQGNWKQNGGTYPMILKKKDISFESLQRPQTPKGPFPYISQEIIVQGPAGKLVGTLTKPDGKGPFPLIILITGSGAQDRDETIFSHKPFFVIADACTRRGYAVLRMDDRGIGNSEGNLSNATSRDLAEDMYACLKKMKEHPEIDKKKIGLLGHSEGGMIAQILAAHYPNDIAFICSMAGLGISGFDILVWQTRKLTSQTQPINEVEKAVKRQKTLLSMIKSSDDSLKLRKALTDSLGTWAVEQQKIFMVNTPEFQAQLRQLQSPWLRYFVKYEPTEFLKKVQCPVFALNGSEDIQVESGKNLEQIDSILRANGNSSVKIKEYKGMNHLFQRCSTCDVAEYAKIETTIEKEVLDDIISWLDEITKKNSKKKIKRR
ncbi:MAG: alpha/beta hydrolase family protein [Candidatus Kapaibacteriota bacterium]